MWSPGVRHFNKVKFTQDFNYQLISLNKYSKTWKSLDFVKLLHWICKIFKVLFVNQSAWYHHEKVNHFCKFYQLEISELCFFCTFRLYLAISQYCREHSLKTLDDAWKNSITGNSAVLQFILNSLTETCAFSSSR